MIFIQELVTHWTKDSRSGPGATERNKTPLSAVVPFDRPFPPGKTDIVIQTTNFLELDEFRPSPVTVAFASMPASGLYESESLTVRVSEGDGLALGIRWNSSFGVPPRKPHDLGVVPFNRWGRVLYNARHGFDRGDWHYYQRTVNIGCLESLKPNNFVATKPFFVKKELADLW